MKNNLLRKGLVFGIIVLFVGVSIVPSISGNIRKSSNVSSVEEFLNEGFCLEKNDEILDLAIVNMDNNDISILLGDGDGGFGNPQDYAVGSEPYGIVTGDFDKDGFLDLAVTNSGDHDVGVLLGDGDGGFGDRQDYSVGISPSRIVAGDFNSNQPPEAPTITGKTNGKAGTEYEYKFKATDPDGDNVKYYIDWGDGTEEWTTFHASGEEVTIGHTWTEQGTYTIRAKAKDVYGAESDWGTLKVTMPKNHQNSQSNHNKQQSSNQLSSNPLFFQILQRLMNTR